MYRFIDYRLPLNDPKPGLMQGQCDDINDVWRQCAQGAGPGEFFTLPDDDVDCDISSNSATANQMILVIGWDKAGNIIQEVKPLNGQNRVQLTNQFFRVKQLLTVANTQSAEPFMDNDGDYVCVYDRSATVVAGEPDTFFGIMDLGKSMGKQGYHYLTPNTNLAFVSAIINADTYEEHELRFLVQFRNINDKIWRTLVDATFINGISNFPLDGTPTLFDANYGTDIRIVVAGTSNVNNVGSIFAALHFVEEIPPN